MSRSPSFSIYIGRPSYVSPVISEEITSGRLRSYLVCLVVELWVILIDLSLLLEVKVSG